VGEAQQALGSTTSAPVCLSIRRQGAAGTVLDSGIINKSPPKNTGTSQTMALGPVGGVDNQILLQFDLSAIPAGPKTNITTASVNLARGVVAPTGPGTLEVHRVLAPWSEATVTWQSLGGAFDPLATATFSNQPTFPSFGLTQLVQSWVRGTVPNYGVLLRDPGTAITSLWTSEYTNYYSRPELYVCYTVSCDPDTADCNGNGLDGCEINLNASTANCGACGAACQVANATPACVNAACQVSSCNLGFADCDHNPQNGCETLLTTSTDCGGCGVACARPHGTASCATGTCTLAQCNPGYFDCDGNPANGCEAMPCANASHCASGAGCTSGVCTSGFCAAPVCNDGVKNGAETGVDCGGSCAPCGVGLGCGTAADCGSGVCAGGACQAPTCTDGVKNGAESGADCGGGACAPCADGVGCLVGGDCGSGVCTTGHCQAPACNDGVKNGAETAVDCGGGACPPCAVGKACGAGADCADLVCASGICQIASCSDGVQNGTETDVDCGGPCTACAAAAHCHASSDCTSGVCVNGFCQAPTCTDGVKNGDETGLDCGGSCYVPEVCNGVDDDCNGLVDDGLGTTTCGVGACQVVVQNCVGGQPQTCVPLAPQVEVCDGLIDDDCDGIVDNGCACTDGHTQSCYTGAIGSLGLGACQSGVQTCAHGQWGACVGEVTPTQETCDGIDNDCNGDIDDGLGQTVCGVGACQTTTPNCVNGLPQVCSPRAPSEETCDAIDNDCDGLIDNNLPTVTCGVGACQNTVPSCVAGQAQACAPLAASAEVCDGLDNDCNGAVDDGNPGGGLPCSTGKLGVCAAGTTVCTGGQIVCQQNVQPSAETCDGQDNDCDGVVDNGNPGANQACSTGKPGICAAGTTVCSSGQLTCQQSQQPHAETCNGQDDDCDGVVDNGSPGAGLACNTGLLGVCGAGTTVCSGGGITCHQTTQASAETCDGLLDQNCNGQVDEGCACVNGATQSCYTGANGTMNVGACHAGTQTCAGGQWGSCVGQVVPTAETCDGVDNNCNGSVDDGLGTISCGVGACGRTVAACAAGHPNTCTPGTPVAETCDGIDNDCDGVVDNGNPGSGAACSTGLLGICAGGTTTCTSGALTCHQTLAATTETCNGLDDNCNGTVDEGVKTTYYRDADGDGYGSAATTTQACSLPTGYVTNSTDCNDGSSAVHPGATELCNNIDDNCNGSVDDGASSSCSGGSVCSAGTCTVTVRPNVLVCGTSSRDVATFFPSGVSLTKSSSCVPDANTQAMLITRGGAGTPTAATLQAYVSGGGILLTEYSISVTVWNKVFGTALSNAASRLGSCTDLAPTNVRFNAADPFWLANAWQTPAPQNPGCGYPVQGFTGITTLAGWDSVNAAIGYRQYGTGRVWATDFDWQDGETSYGSYAYTAGLMGYMITHRN
jgi:hypothetical protein